MITRTSVTRIKQAGVHFIGSVVHGEERRHKATGTYPAIVIESLATVGTGTLGQAQHHGFLDRQVVEAVGLVQQQSKSRLRGLCSPSGTFASLKNQVGDTRRASDDRPFDAQQSR